METGKIARLVKDKGFGFIKSNDSGTEYFFHRSALQEGTRWDDLREGQEVDFQPGEGPKGPRAEEVRA